LNKKIVSILLVFIILTIIIPTNIMSISTDNYKIINKNITDYDLDDFLANYIKNNNILGLSAAIVRNGAILWKGAFGYAHYPIAVHQRRLVNNNTLFILASVSKTITATALMQLYEKGLFELNDPINDYLPFNVINPKHPYTPITFYMLLTHTSSINDNWADAMPVYWYPFHFPWSLGEYYREYFTPSGIFYNPHRNFNNFEPGSELDYSNIGAGLVGYLVEVISNTSFSEYCQENIFVPLNMNETSWFWYDLDLDHLATPNLSTGQFISHPHYQVGCYPAATLRTSSVQLCNFLNMYIQKGRFGSNNLLNESTINLMTTPKVWDTGLIWYEMGENLWGHTGHYYGTSTIMMYDKNNDIGIIIFTNSEGKYFDDLLSLLLDYAREQPYDNPPNNPQKPNGQNFCDIDETYSFSTFSADPDGGELYYMWDWGDSNYSDWVGPYNSTYSVMSNHSWSNSGVCNVKVKSRDQDGHESDWSEPLEIIIDTSEPHIKINKPSNAIYINDNEVMPFPMPFVFGSINCNFTVLDNESGIKKIEIYLDNTKISEYYNGYVNWLWDTPSFGSKKIKIIAWDNANNIASQEIKVLKIF